MTLDEIAEDRPDIAAGLRKLFGDDQTTEYTIHCDDGHAMKADKDRTITVTTEDQLNAVLDDMRAKKMRGSIRLSTNSDGSVTVMVKEASMAIKGRPKKVHIN